MFALTSRKEIGFRALLVLVICFSAMTPMGGITTSALAQAEEPTATPTETVTETPTTEPAVTPAITQVSTKTAIPIPITETPSPTPTPPETTDLLQNAVDGPVLLLSSNPAFLTPGRDLTLTWEITGVSLEGRELVLNILLPEGFFWEESKGGAFDETTHTLTISVENTKGQVHLKIEKSTGDAAISAQLLEKDKVLASASLFLPAQEQFVMQKSGGEIEALDGKVRIEFPQDSLPEKATIKVGKPAGEKAPPDHLLGSLFEVTAEGEQSRQELKHFANELSVLVSYADLGIPEELEGWLHLYWYDEDTGEWTALPTVVNREAKVLRALTDHFTVFDIGINNWQASHLPTVDAFQVSSFTGAGTYSLSIQVPPGPGGFQPSLALNYNSQVVDQSTLNTQASWVGMGWSLDTGSVELDLHGTPNWPYDDTYLLNAGGVGTRIVQDTNGAYHATDENFWKIDFNGSTWTVWDKQGTTYYFEYVSQYPYQLYGCPNENTEIGWQVYRWSLTRVKNIFNQEIQYGYSQQTKNVRLQEYITSTHTCRTVDKTAVTATYPSTVTYANGKYRVRFDIVQNRQDFPANWDTDAVFHTFEKYRLQNIYVEQANSSGVFETIIRRYELSYAAGTDSDIIFPGYIWSAGGKTTTLRSVREYGVGGAASLPAVTFTYGDNLHLTQATNGYGGSVKFDYDDHPTATLYQPWYYAADARDSYTIEVSTRCLDYDPSPWYPRPPHNIDCGNNGNRFMNFRGTITAGNIANPSGSVYGPNQSKDLIRPGGVYKLAVPIGLAPGMSGQVGLFTGYADVMQPISQDGTYYITLPPNAMTMQPVLEAMDAAGNYATTSTFKLQLLPSVYRVLTKQVSDGIGHTYTYEYSYLNNSGADTAGVNDATLSPTGTCERGSTTCYEYTERFSEFRGHAQVTETREEDGTQTITQFNQDDLFKGRPSLVTINDGAQKVSEEKYTYYYATLPIALYRDEKGGWLPYVGLGRNWIYMDAVEKRIYGSDGALRGETRTAYTYDPTYGNVLTETEQSKNGTDWGTYRTTQTEYFPNAANNLVSLPARVRVLDASDNVLSSILFLYDDNLGSYETPPVNGKLTATRTRVSTDSALWSQVVYGYDAWGNRTSETTYSGYGTPFTSPATGARTTYTCYGGGGTLGGTACTNDGYHIYPLWSKNPLGQITTWTYDYTRSVPLTESNPNDSPSNDTTVSAIYDAFGRMTGLIHPGDDAANPTLRITYNDATQPFRIDLEQRMAGSTYSVIRKYYDGMGRLLQHRIYNAEVGGQNLLVVVNFAYDAYGRVVKQTAPFTLPLGSPYSFDFSHPFTEISYDALGRSQTVTAPDGTQTSTQTNGLQTTYTDARSNSTITTNDVWGRVEFVDAPDGPDVTYTYDELNRLKTATRGGVTTAIKYDHAGRKINMDDPDMGTAGTVMDDLWAWTYQYDALGNLTSQTDARGCTLTLTYDLLNRLDTKTSPGGNCGQQISVDYNYDSGLNGKGLRTSMTDASGSTTWTYDNRGRIVSEVKNISGTNFTTGWAYNSADLPTSMTYPDGEVVNYTYNTRMMLNTVIGSSTYVSSTGYDSAGRLTSRALGNGLTQTYTYYPWNASGQGGRLQTLTTGSLQNLTYTYDPIGNILSITDALAQPQAQVQSFTYDTLDRLTSANASGGTNGIYSETYNYNSATGNLESKGALTLSYNDVNHVHAVTSAGGNYYGYDANGNMITRDINSGPLLGDYVLAYDAENRLVSVTKDGTPLASFVYDGDGKQVKSVVNGVTSLYVGAYYEVQGSSVTKYYFAGSTRIAFRKGGVLNYLLSDHLGSSSITTDANGNSLAQMLYTAWGETRYATGNLNTAYRYTGQREESSFGLYFYNARWVDVALGRFAQADTIIPEQSQGVQAWDRFAYTSNNPIKYTDPSGHCTEWGDNWCFDQDNIQIDSDFTDEEKELITNVISSYDDLLGGDGALERNSALIGINKEWIDPTTYYALYEHNTQTVNLPLNWYSPSIYRNPDGSFTISASPVNMEDVLGFPEGSLPSDEISAQFVLAHEMAHSIAFGNPEIIDSFQETVKLPWSIFAGFNPNPLISRNAKRSLASEVFADVLAAAIYSPDLLNQQMSDWVQTTMPNVLK